MAFDLRGAFIGMANPDIAIDNYFRDKNLRKRLTTAAEVEEEARAKRARAMQEEADLEASKQEYSDTMRTAAALGPQEIAPGVIRPSFTNAAMTRAEAATAPTATSANQFSTARAIAPLTREMGETTGENVIAENKASTLKSMLAADEAEFELGLKPERAARTQSRVRRDIKLNEAGITAAENQQQRDAAEIAAKIPKLLAGNQARQLQFNMDSTAALMREKVPETTAQAVSTRNKLAAQNAAQAAAIGKITPKELDAFRTLDVRAKFKALKMAAAQASLNSALSTLKTKSVEEFINPSTGDVDFGKLKQATGLDQGDIIQLILGYLRGGNVMQNYIGGMLEGGGAGRNPTTATQRDVFDED